MRKTSVTTWAGRFAGGALAVGAVLVAVASPASAAGTASAWGETKSEAILDAAERCQVFQGGQPGQIVSVTREGAGFRAVIACD